MKDTYKYDAESNVVRVCSDPRHFYENAAIRDFCEDHNINLEEFNIPVIIEDCVKSCQKLFSGCAGFNQEVIIPEEVDDCFEMFKDCESFNQPIKMTRVN